MTNNKVRESAGAPSPMAPDLSARIERHAAPFLACLLGARNSQAEFTFQTFTDPEPKPKPDLNAHVIHGSLEQCAAELRRLNQAGAGVFVTVNGTDGRGRKKGNANALRGWWADLDTKGASLPFDPPSLPLQPTMIVKTPGGWHLYWLAPEPMPCESDARRDEHEAELRGIQQALEPYGADPKVCDVLRVMRLPGFLHRKDEPRLVELQEVDGPRWTQEQIRAAFPAKVKQAKGGDTKPKPLPVPPQSDRAQLLKRARAYLATMPGGVQGSDGSGTTFQAALKTITGFGLGEDEALDLMWEIHNSKCVPPWSLEELQHKVADAWKVAQKSPDLGHLAREQRPGLPTHPEDTGWPSEEDAPQPDRSTPEDPSSDDRPHVPGFEWKAKGLYIAGEPEKTSPAGDPIPGKPAKWIAPPFTLPGLVRDEASQGWRLLIAWHDLDGTAHEEALPFEILSGEGTELARTLAQGGMVLSPDPAPRKALLRYLCKAAPRVKRRVRLVDALGWHAGAFVLPSGETIGQTLEAVRFAGDAGGLRAAGSKGLLEEWQRQVARLAVGNPRLAFAMASAFAGPLLELVRPDGGGGFNLMGFSSKGKSTCLEAAASVWGRPDPLPTWRATGNGLEGIAATRNDGFLVLDELSQVDPKEAGSVAYMLANGSAKARANREGGTRTMRQWRLVFLSSGEQGLEDKMLEDGKRSRAGQEVRVPDIPCPAEGMFETAHDLPSLGALAEHLKSQARKNYGHAARVFLQQLCVKWEQRDSLISDLRSHEAAWLSNAIPAGADAQVRRVAGRFALVAVAGELAQRMGILPWPRGEAERAALICFKAWLDRRGFTGASEVHRGIAAVLAFLEKHGQARFDIWGEASTQAEAGTSLGNPKTFNRVGTRRKAEGVDGWDYYIPNDAWKEVCQGFTARSVAQACADAGILEPDSEGKLSRPVKIPGHGKVRCYVIRALSIAQYCDKEAA